LQQGWMNFHPNIILQKYSFFECVRF
jgi:hypothetical protein